MKTKLKKHVSLLMCLMMIVSLMTPVPAYAAGETEDFPTLILSPAYLVKSDQEQTVTMEIRLPVDTACVSYSYTIISNGAISMQSATAEINGMKNERADDVNPDDRYEEYVSMGAVTFNVPANTAGEFSLGIADIILYNGTENYVEGESVSIPLTIYKTAADAPVQGNAVSLQGPAAALVREKVLYTIQVTGESYASAQMQLTYDSQLLTFDQTNSFYGASASGGTVTLVDYGVSKTPPQQYTVAFTAAADGTAITKLTAAAFGTSDSAVSGDLTAATIETASVSTKISKASFSVNLPQGVTGNASVNNGGNYSFRIASPETKKYTYNVTATMDGQPVEVIANADGTYTIETVTGDLAITVTPVPKQYTVTFKSNTIAKEDLPAAGEAVYDMDYKFDIPAQNGCTVAVTSVTIDGTAYEYPDVVNRERTIPGTAIIGDIVINLERITATVTVEGTGASDVKYEPAATVGDTYTLTLNKVAGYDYTVSATMDGEKVSLTVADNKYTIAKVTGPIVFTVQKSINTENTSVKEYLKLSGTSVWLIKAGTAKLNEQVYFYNNTKMVWSEAYNTYCCLVISETEPQISADTLKLESGSAATLAASFDVNRSGKVDANDAQLTYDLYNGTYTDFTKVSMEKFLLADTNNNGVVDTSDAAAIVNKIFKP